MVIKFQIKYLKLQNKQLYLLDDDVECAQDMLGPEQAYEGLYGQGPPSVHSSHGGRAFQQGMYAHFKLC